MKIGAGPTSDIDENLNVMFTQEFDEFFKTFCGMADGV